MRQTLMYAAIHMAFSIGVRQNAWKLTSKCGQNESALKEDFTQYVEPATEMFEIAEEMAMDKPSEAERMFYDGVGNWYASYIREHEKLPEREEVLAGMAEGCCTIFHDVLSHTQREALAKKLKEFE